MSNKIEIISDEAGVFFSAPCFDAALSLDCGQAFRWRIGEDASISGIAGSKPLKIIPQGGGYFLPGIEREEFEGFWRGYFDLDRDYGGICRALCADESLRAATKFCPGIHILRQEPWETLCSFIISQNNNIPRIKGIIERLCELLGDRLNGGIYTFPSPESIVEAGVEALAPIRAGFRAKYIYDAALKVSSGEVDFDKIFASGIEEGEEELLKIKGVGKKVAQCTLLYGFGKVDAFPVDVWVKRIMEEMYPSGLPECASGVEGIAQQYLFHWRRNAAVFSE